MIFVLSILFLIGYEKSIWVDAYTWIVIIIFVIYATVISVFAVIELGKDLVSIAKEKAYLKPEEEEEGKEEEVEEIGEKTDREISKHVMIKD